jgi:probable phosphoglycerate mutase
MASEAAGTTEVATARPPASRAAKATATAAARAGAKATSKPKLAPATLILFVRHGLTPTTGKVLPGRAPGLHLADSGRAEAEAVAERLGRLVAAPTPDSARSANGRAPGTRPGLTVAAVYASPLERARETAAPIAKRLGHKVTIERGLIEMDFGEWTGAELKALYKLPDWTAVQRYPSGFQFPGGEGFSAMRARIAATVAGLCRRHPGETVVAVSHADIIKAAVADALGTHLDLFQRIVISTCSVTAISYSATGPTVLAVNSTGGLGDLRPS